MTASRKTNAYAISAVGGIQGLDRALAAFYKAMSLLCEVHPGLRVVRDYGPLLHHRSRARLEVLCCSCFKQFHHALLWELHHEVVLGRHHREDLAVDFESAGAETFAVPNRSVPVSGKSSDYLNKSRIALRGPGRSLS